MMHELAAFASAVASRALSEKILTILQIAELHQLVLHWFAKIIFMFDDVGSESCKACRTLCWVYDRLKILHHCIQLFKAIVAKKKRKMEFRTIVQSHCICLNKQ